MEGKRSLGVKHPVGSYKEKGKSLVLQEGGLHTSS